MCKDVVETCSNGVLDATTWACKEILNKKKVVKVSTFQQYPHQWQSTRPARWCCIYSEQLLVMHMSSNNFGFSIVLLIGDALANLINCGNEMIKDG